MLALLLIKKLKRLGSPLVVLLLVVGCSASDSESECPGQRVVPASPISSPAWHPAGQLITFNLVPLVSVAFPDGPDCPGRQVFDYAQTGVYVVDVDSLKNGKLISASVSDPSWSPAGDLLAFTSGGDIFAVAFDGAGFDTLSVRRLTFDGSSFDPNWSADGLSIAYERVGCSTPAPMVDSTSCGLLRMDPNGGGKRPLTVGRWPSWFPDSKRIAYVGLYEDLYTFNTEDSVIVRLTHFNSATSSTRHLSHPMVCPDGAIIAYASQPVNGTTNIWLIDQNGANPRPVTTEGTLNRFYWSPDARQIVFVSYRTTDWSTENGSLWLVDVSSGARRRIATGGLE